MKATTGLGPDWDLLPEHMHGAMRRYLEDGLYPGGFLGAVLSNDLVGAVRGADHINSKRLSDIVQFCMWSIPSTAWGSPQAVEKWIRDRQQQGG